LSRNTRFNKIVRIMLRMIDVASGKKQVNPPVEKVMSTTV
jgi:hypothetical protein